MVFFEIARQLSDYCVERGLITLTGGYVLSKKLASIFVV
jgi:hypothetical protein